VHDRLRSGVAEGQADDQYHCQKRQQDSDHGPS
jgi:hypothetical protein